MNRGDVIVVAMPGDYGKARPAVIVQNNDLNIDSVLVCLFTSDPEGTADYRQTIQPTPDNGLRELSIIMTDKVQAARRDKCGRMIGRLSDSEMQTLDENLAFVLGLGA